MDDLAPYLGKLLDWLLQPKDPASAEGWAARIAIWLLIGVAILYLLSKALEFLLSIKNSSSGLGINFSLSSALRTEIRRRQQFCKALVSDLAFLAKSENWNDQFFTDLEAQIEAEGRFYATNIDKLFHRESIGLRRSRSLIGAIESSAEQFLLLTGEPGSGKSVALRHLAHQYATRSSRSGSLKARIPLYINLKELPPSPKEGLTAEFIRQFVLDNIRRGDVDTADYVKEHWDEYRNNGTWLFLFDSFDEIPAILHAPSGSSIIADHANALRQFLSGMSSCRGIIASREFKGPNVLAWQKLRILPLSQKRRTEIVANYFLPEHHRAAVGRHLGITNSTLYTNPLFVTLLCRHVKDEGEPPINDLDLLYKHLNRLTSRDSEYINRRYHITPHQLMQGAIMLSRLFAEDPNLSLAPSMGEIAGAANQNEVPGGDLESLLAALVYVKIGRSDIQEARSGDRRFTFAHRRYQETLFVQLLATTPGYVSERELLCNVKWREYTVTLLQTQPTHVLQPLLKAAEDLIEEYGQQGRTKAVMEKYGGTLSYYDWRGDPCVHLLNLLQEGLSRRISDAPPRLREVVGALLMPRWRNGDFLDQYMVLSVGGLMPANSLIEILEDSVRFGSEQLLRVAFRQCLFLSQIPPSLVGWLRRRLSEESLAARGQGELLKIEALGARLPQLVGAEYISKRCRLFRRVNVLYALSRWFKKDATSVGREAILLNCSLALVLAAAAFRVTDSWVAVVACSVFPPLSYGFYIFCDVGQPLGVSAIRSKWHDLKSDRITLRLSQFYSRSAVIGAVFLAVFIVIDMNFLRGSAPVPVYIVVASGGFLLGSIAQAAGALIEGYEIKMKFRRLRLSAECENSIALHADDGFELKQWYSSRRWPLFKSEDEVRSYGRAILGSVTIKLECGHSGGIFALDKSALPDWHIRCLNGVLLSELQQRGLLT